MFTYIFSSERVVEETSFDRRTVSQMHTELKFERLAKYVSTRVPESLLAFWSVESKELKLHISFKWARCVVEHPAFAFLGSFLLRVLELVVETLESSVGVPNLANNHFRSKLF